MVDGKALEKIGKGSLIILAGFVLGTFFQYLYKMILARILGPESFGVFVLALAILQSVTTVAMLGLQISTPRYISYYTGKENPGKMERTVSTGLILVVLSSIVSSLLLLFFSAEIATTIFNEPALVTPLKIFSIAVPTLALGTFVLTMFQGQQDAYRHALVDDFLWSGSLLMLVAAAVFLGYRVVGAAAAYLASTVVCLIAGVYIYRRNYRHGFTFSDLEFRSLLSFTWPLFLISVFGILTRWFDVLMLGWLVSSTESGIYDVAFSLAGYVALVMEIIGFMLMPVITELHAKAKKKRVRELYSTSTRWMTTATLPVIAGIVIFPEEIIAILFGSEYTSASFALILLGLGFFYRVMKGPASITLISAGENRKLLVGKTITVSLIVLLNLLLIPRYGINGAAASTLIAFLVGDTILLYIIKRQLGKLPSRRSFAKIFVSGLAASGTVAALNHLLDPGLAASVALGAILVAIYTALLFRLEGFEKEDTELFRELVTRKIG